MVSYHKQSLTDDASPWNHRAWRFCTPMMARSVSCRAVHPFLKDSPRGYPAHSDAVWGVSWTNADTVLSISADGSIKQWDSNSGQVSRSRAPHTLGLVSLSVDPAGKLALYNTLEGLTSLWDLEDGEVKGSFESYARSAGSESTEPCTSLISPLCTLPRYSGLGANHAPLILSVSGRT